MKKSILFLEAKRLHGLGFAVHWLHAKSKRPIEAGWTSGPRKPWKYLEETFKEGLNLGVRLGEPSKLGAGYLAAIDCDVKSTEKKHLAEMVSKVRELLGGQELPMVASGRGNGSRHYYVTTLQPLTGFLWAQSPDRVKVQMRGQKPSQGDLAALTEAEIEAGWRTRPAWEISVMGSGRQVVLPPSIHPDTGKPYAWVRGDASKICAYALDLKSLAPQNTAEAKPSEAKLLDFEPVAVDLGWLPIPDDIRELIKTGAGSTDRSAELLKCAYFLVRTGLSEQEVLSVLTDPHQVLAETCYEHAATRSRKAAAAWLWKYTVKKAFDEQSAEKMFREIGPEDVNAEIIEADVVKALELEVAGMSAPKSWRDSLDRTEQGKLRNTFKNAKLLFVNSVEGAGKGLARNEFAAQDYFALDLPWGSHKGSAVTDHDTLRFKAWAVRKWGIEFNLRLVDEVFSNIADENKFHPVRNWLRSLKWDGVQRIGSWLKDYAFAVAPEPYLTDVSRKVLIAMVKRVMEPGCKFDQVLIMEGEQGVGKSSLVKALAGEWYTDAPLILGDKDVVLTMQGKWIIELGELSTLSKADTDQLKAFVSSPSDRIRVPYGHRMEEFPRQCVFIGTTNNVEYLKDPTGNRRYWPVSVGQNIQWTELEAARDQLFAEAFEAYKACETLYLDNHEARTQSLVEQSSRMISDEVTNKIATVLVSNPGLGSEFTIAQLSDRMPELGAQKLAPADTQRIARALKVLGYLSYRKSTGIRERVWKKDEEKDFF